MYTAVVLEQAAQEWLKEWTRSHFPEADNPQWTLKCHHMTIQMGRLPEYRSHILGSTQKLRITHVSWTNLVIAARVEGFFSDNPIPHITLAVNYEQGGKPQLSNQLTNWMPVNSPVILNGTVQEQE